MPPPPDLDLTQTGGVAADEAIADRWRAAFARAAANQDIHARLDGAADQLEIVFDGQENADGERILGAYLDELRTCGVTGGRHLVARGDLDAASVTRVAAALEHGLLRLRILLIENNSYISGGLAWVFDEPQSPLAARGLAIYRFPATANVDVTAIEGAIRIDVHPADLGEVVSSGFYVPTRIRGDFRAHVRYRLPRWQPGPATASVALFAQDEPSLLRYYAQRRSAGDGPHELIANFHNRVLSTPVPVSGDHGSFAVQRVGDVVSSWHGEGDGALQKLAEHHGDPTDDIFVGFKIWSSGRVEGLQAEVHELTITGEIPQEQILPVPLRDDPRG